MVSYKALNTTIKTQATEAGYSICHKNGFQRSAARKSPNIYGCRLTAMANPHKLQGCTILKYAHFQIIDTKRNQRFPQRRTPIECVIG